MDGFSLHVRSRFSVPELTLGGFSRTIRVMAKTVITQVTDDLDGSTGAETISFAYRGTTYEIDLGRRNASAFDKMMKPYLDAARKVTAPRGGRRGSNNGRRAARRSSAGATSIRMSSGTGLLSLRSRAHLRQRYGGVRRAINR